jgi:hypothetical protein
MPYYIWYTAEMNVYIPTEGQNQVNPDSILGELTSQGISSQDGIVPQRIELFPGDNNTLEIRPTHAVVFGWTDDDSRDQLIADLRAVFGEDSDGFGIFGQTPADQMEIVGFSHSIANQLVKVVAVLLRSPAQIMPPWYMYVGGGVRANFDDVFFGKVDTTKYDYYGEEEGEEGYR